MIKNIWTDGFEIERDGQKIVLTTKEIREIERAIEAQNGLGSLEYYVEGLEWKAEDGDEEAKELMSIAEELMEDEKACTEIWNNFLENVMYDSGCVELDTVEDYINDYKSEKENR